MTPEAAAFLAKAKELLDEAAIMLNVELAAPADRTADLAGFHAAQALIVDRAGQSPKTHKASTRKEQRATNEAILISA